jgi:hypothetical protein
VQYIANYFHFYLQYIAQCCYICSTTKNNMATVNNTPAHSFTVGTILIDSWGYEQTNVDAYQIIEATDKTVLIRQIATIEENDGGLSMTGKVSPIADKFIGTPIRKRVTTTYRKRPVENPYIKSEYSIFKKHTPGKKYFASHYA